MLLFSCLFHYSSHIFYRKALAISAPQVHQHIRSLKLMIMFLRDGLIAVLWSFRNCKLINRKNNNLISSILVLLCAHLKTTQKHSRFAVHLTSKF